MKTRAPYAFVLLTTMLATLAGCQGSGGVEPDTPRPGDPGGVGAEKPVNLLNEMGRSQLYFDLDQYTQSYMAARAKGDSAAWTSLHTIILSPKVDENLSELLKTVESKAEHRYRVIGARALGFATDAGQAVPALVDLLNEPDPVLVNSSLVSLYYLASPKTPLLPLVALMNHPDGDVRSNDALALFAVLRQRRIDGRVPMSSELREVSGRLIAAVSDPRDPDVRGHAAAALGEIGDPIATDILVNLLTDESSFVRIRAAMGLGQLGQEQAIPPLLDALGDAEVANEAKILAASLEKIAKTLGFPCDAEALGTDATRWRTWYSAVRG